MGRNTLCLLCWKSFEECKCLISTKTGNLTADMVMKRSAMSAEGAMSALTATAMKTTTSTLNHRRLHR